MSFILTIRTVSSTIPRVTVIIFQETNINPARLSIFLKYLLQCKEMLSVTPDT